jgi:hypothetical protein
MGFSAYTAPVVRVSVACSASRAIHMAATGVQNDFFCPRTLGSPLTDTSTAPFSMIWVSSELGAHTLTGSRCPFHLFVPPLTPLFECIRDEAHPRVAVPSHLFVRPAHAARRTYS